MSVMRFPIISVVFQTLISYKLFTNLNHMHKLCEVIGFSLSSESALSIIIRFSKMHKLYAYASEVVSLGKESCKNRNTNMKLCV